MYDKMNDLTVPLCVCVCVHNKIENVRVKREVVNDLWKCKGGGYWRGGE